MAVLMFPLAIFRERKVSSSQKEDPPPKKGVGPQVVHLYQKNSTSWISAVVIWREGKNTRREENIQDYRNIYKLALPYSNAPPNIEIHHIKHYTRRISPHFLLRAIHAAVSPPTPASNAPFSPITRTIA